MESSQEKQDPKAVPPLCEECGYELKGFHDCRASRVMAVEEAGGRIYPDDHKVEGHLAHVRKLLHGR